MIRPEDDCQVGGQHLTAQRIREEDMEPEAPVAPPALKTAQLPAPVSPPRIVGQTESSAPQLPPEKIAASQAPTAAPAPAAETVDKVPSRGAADAPKPAVPAAPSSQPQPVPAAETDGAATGSTTAKATHADQAAAQAAKAEQPGRVLRLANMVRQKTPCVIPALVRSRTAFRWFSGAT
jgi:hypothetical protein